MSKQSIANRTYWDSFYKGGVRELSVPSQFAVFVAGEAEDVDGVIDIGCGNGRDTLFFAHHFDQVRGIDASEEAVADCAAKAERNGLDARFDVQVLGTESFRSVVSELISGFQKPLIYARFFLHAVNEENEAELLDIIAGSIGDGMFAAEFRTQRDEALGKVTPNHYRRFIDPMQLAARAGTKGLSVRYFAEGFGMAKYKHDDAHVARMIFARG